MMRILSAKPLIHGALVALVLAATPVSAQSILGTWLSPPDGKKQTGHVVVSRCGAAFCGKLVRTYDRNGAPIITKNTGKTLFWNLVEVSPETYRNGRVFVPIMNLTANAEIDVVEDRLMIRGCKGPICKKQTWSRVD